jgi:hypothetical protein
MAPAMLAQQYPLEKLEREAFSTTILKLQLVGIVSIRVRVLGVCRGGMPTPWPPFGVDRSGRCSVMWLDFGGGVYCSSVKS